MPRERRCLDPNAFIKSIFAQVSAPQPSRNDGMNRVAFGGDAEFFLANVNQWPDVARLQLVGINNINDGLPDFCFGVRQCDLENFGAIE